MIRFIAWSASAFFAASMFSFAFLGVPFWEPVPNTAEGAFRTLLLMLSHGIGLPAGLIYEALE